MNKTVRGQVRLGTITHQSLGQKALEDSSCLSGKNKGGGSGWKWVRKVPANNT